MSTEVNTNLDWTSGLNLTKRESYAINMAVNRFINESVEERKERVRRENEQPAVSTVTSAGIPKGQNKTD